MLTLTRTTAKTMIPRLPIVAAVAVIAALAAGAAPAGASTVPSARFAFAPGLAGAAATPLFQALPVGIGGNAPSPGGCNTPIAGEGQGATGGVQNSACMGTGLSFIGPSIGQIASVMGPTNIGATIVIGTSVVAAGDVMTGPSAP
jgi:hypothetical protein